MYNQGNHGPQFRPAYQQALPHFQQVPPPPHGYLHGPPTTSSTVPVNLPIQVPPSGMQSAGQSYAIPSQLHGNSMLPPPPPPPPQTFSSIGQSHHVPLPVPPPPPPLGHTHQGASWAPGPLPRVLPPPPPPLSSSQGQVLYKPPPPPSSGSGFLAPTPDGVSLHSTVGNYQVPSISPPPLPSSPPPILPSPPPPMTSASFHAVPSGPNSSSAPVHNSNPNQDSGSCREVAVADRDEILSSRSVILDLPPAPPRPTKEKTVQKIEALCQLIAENGPDIEEKIRRDEFQNPEYTFLFGGDPGTEDAISHAYFLWVKKKYNLENRWHEKKSESQLRPLAVDSTVKQYHLHVATESADSDMEMEDDITLTDKDQESDNSIEALTQQHDRVDEKISTNENVHQLQNSTENDPAKDIISSGASCFGSIGVSKQHEGPGFFTDLEHMKSARSVTEVHSPVHDSFKAAEFPTGTVLEKSSAPLSDQFTRNGTSDLSEATNPDRDSGQLIRSGSPIRLLQDYASDDTSGNEDETSTADASILTVSAGAAASVSVAHKDSRSYLETDIGSKSPSSNQKGFGQLSKTAQNDSEIAPHIEQDSRGTCKESVSRWTSDKCTEDNLENQVSVSASIEAFQGKDGLGGTCIDGGSKSGDAEKEDEKKASKFEPNILKVDEFGRHPREVPTDSDSDDSRYRQTRRVNKRDRSWSRSRSPLDRRRSRRRRSPRRRKDKRSRSRSRSPRHRRSRSRSPIIRRSGDFGGENVRRDRGQCFDFLRGKCYRGASCRYIHESDKNASSRRYKNKHDLEVSSRAKSSRINKGMKNISSKVSDHEHDGVRNQDVDFCQAVTGQEVQQRKEESVGQAVVSSTFGLDSQSVNNGPINSESFKEAAPEVQGTISVREEPKTLVNDNDSFQKAGNSHQQHLVDGFCHEALSSGDGFKPSGVTYEDVHSEDGSFVHRQPNVSVGVSEDSSFPSQLITSSDHLPCMVPSTQLQSATTSVDPQLSSELPSLHSQAPKELTPPGTSSAELPLLNYHLPLPVVSHAQGENAVHEPHISRDYGVMQQNALFPFQSTTREKFDPYPALLHTQNSHFSVPPNSSWTSLPPPPPPSRMAYNSSLNSGGVKSYVSSEFNHSQLHSRADFVSQTSGKPGLPSHSHSSEFRDQSYPPMQDHSRTFMLTEAFSPKHPSQGNPASQLLSGPEISREDHYKQFSMQDSKFPSSTSFGSLHPQPKQHSWQPDLNRQQPSLGGNLPSEEHFKTSSHIHPSLQKQQSMYNFQYSASEGNLGVPGENVTVSRFPPDVLDSNHLTSLSAFGGSRISAHYNPYASTFEQPLSSKFSSSIFRQESDIILGSNYGSSRLNHTPINRGGVGLRQSASSPKSARVVGDILPRSAGDQYDPLFDSIEPSSSYLKKFDFESKQEVTGESNISLRPKSSLMPLDVEEKNKHEEVGAVASTTSQTNDEYGETADAEVGAVDMESLSNHVDVANTPTGEIEINQSKSPGKRKKSKDSRSMKLFKISIANFVKEVLKPSWRQGNMSKVAFKTIVKKTVDKVSGAMKGHRIPKSQAKISQYIDSSQRKLTKLVMGYVDKYVKV